MVPMDRPAYALQMITNFLANSANFSTPVQVENDKTSSEKHFRPILLHSQISLTTLTLLQILLPAVERTATAS